MSSNGSDLVRVDASEPVGPPAAHPFKPGNKAAVGNRGPSRPDFLTQTLISQLNEVDRTTGQPKKHLLVERLIARALDGDAQCMREIFNRVEGRPRLAEPDESRQQIMIVLDCEDLKL